MAKIPFEQRFTPIKRTAIDGKVWWVVADNERRDFSHFTCHGKYNTKKECQAAINFWNGRYGEQYFR